MSELFSTKIRIKIPGNRGQTSHLYGEVGLGRMPWCIRGQRGKAKWSSLRNLTLFMRRAFLTRIFCFPSLSHFLFFFLYNPPHLLLILYKYICIGWLGFLNILLQQVQSPLVTTNFPLRHLIHIRSLLKHILIPFHRTTTRYLCTPTPR